MNFRPYFNIENARIAYTVISAIVWAMTIAIWCMFSFSYAISFMLICQLAFYLLEYLVYHINPIDVFTIWFTLGREEANKFVYTKIFTH